MKQLNFFMMIAMFASVEILALEGKPESILGSYTLKQEVKNVKEKLAFFESKTKNFDLNFENLAIRLDKFNVKFKIFFKQLLDFQTKVQNSSINQLIKNDIIDNMKFLNGELIQMDGQIINLTNAIDEFYKKTLSEFNKNPWKFLKNNHLLIKLDESYNELNGWVNGLEKTFNEDFNKNYLQLKNRFDEESRSNKAWKFSIF